MSDETTNRRRGKVAQCPRHIREHVCRMLDNGRQGPEILAWLNAQPEVAELISRDWEGFPISDNNLSQWFKGGYQQWRAEQEEVEKTTAMAELSMRIAKEAGGSIGEGALAVAGGKVLAALESAEGEGLLDLVLGVARIRGKELEGEKVKLAAHRNRQRDEMIALERDKFERLVVGKFIDWAANEKAREIAAGPGAREVKMDQLVALMFGPRPATA